MEFVLIEAGNGEKGTVTYHGRVENGVVVLEGGATLPEGTAVVVETCETRPTPGAEDPLYSLGELATSSGIRDLALNIDHYLYGHPKVGDVRQ
jgi:hypothetical protein